MFLASKLIWTVAAPDMVLAILAVIALVTGWRRLGALVAAVIVVIAVLPVGDWLLQPLENRFPMIHAPAHVDGIVMLGGGIDPVSTLERGRPALTGAGARLVTFADLAHRYPDAKLVFTGGSSLVFGHEEREGDAFRRMLPAFGLDPKQVIIEDRSRTTAENAADTRRLVHPAPGQVWLLVTSAWHMPRAVGVFRQAGWPVVPYPTDYLTSADTWRLDTLDFVDNLARVRIALKEWVGLVAYRLTGRTDALFPGPTPP